LAPPLVTGFEPCDLTLDDLVSAKSASERGELARDDLERTLEQNPDGLTSQELAAVLDRPERTIRHQLRKLHEDGRASILVQQRGSNPAVWGP
jgi:hypothetical protein